MSAALGVGYRFCTFFIVFRVVFVHVLESIFAPSAWHGVHPDGFIVCFIFQVYFDLV